MNPTDTLTAYLTDPDAHPLTYPVLAGLVALLLLQALKSHRFPWWDPPAKWQPHIAASMAAVGAGVAVYAVGGGAGKALLSALMAAFLPQGMYSVGARPVLATPPASVPPPGAP